MGEINFYTAFQEINTVKTVSNMNSNKEKSMTVFQYLTKNVFPKNNLLGEKHFTKINPLTLSPLLPSYGSMATGKLQKIAVPHMFEFSTCCTHKRMRLELFFHMVFFLLHQVVPSESYCRLKNDRFTMAGRSSRYNLCDVLELLDSENLDDFGLVESEDSDCEGGEVRSYLPEVQLYTEEPYHSVGDTLELESDAGPSKSPSRAFVVLVDSVNLWYYRLRLSFLTFELLVIL